MSPARVKRFMTHLKERNSCLCLCAMLMCSLPVKWVDKSIMVADQALINPPYTVESVISVSAALNGSSEDEKTTLLTRIKHVVCPSIAKRG